MTRQSLAFLVGCIVGVCLGWLVHFESSLTIGQGMSLSFSEPGTVAFIAPIGQPLKTGDLIAQLQNSDLVSAKMTALTGVVIEQAKMNELDAVDTEELAFSAKEQAREQASASSTLARANRALAVTALSSASSSLAAVSVTDRLFSTSTNSAIQTLLPVDSLTAAALVSGWQSAHASAILAMTEASSSNIQEENNNLAEIQLFMDDVSIAVGESAIAANSDAGIIPSIAHAKSAVDAALNQLLSAEAASEQAGSIVQSLSSATTPPVGQYGTTFTINLAAQQAQEALALQAAQTSLTTASSSLAGTYIYAPAAGQVISREASEGQPVGAGQPVVVYTLR